MIKFSPLLTTLLISISSLSVFAQQQDSKSKILLATKEQADIAQDNEWLYNRWRISPQIPHDTLNVYLYGKKEAVAFRTDKDSIRFHMQPGDVQSFYVKMGDAAPAHTIIVAKSYPWDQVNYTKGKQRNDLRVRYENSTHSYFDSLRNLYPVANLIENDHNDKERVLTVLNWVHHQWKHNGGVTPKGSDGISILNEVKAGGQFPCFAYAIVLRDELTSLGFKARVLYLKTKDAETRNSSPGHVVTEVYLKDQKKWVFVDGQFNVMPALNGKPLNAVEFQQALSRNYEKVQLLSRDKVSKRYYTDFVYEYLYYFDTALDNRILPGKELVAYQGNTKMMLVPEGAPNLTKMKFFNGKITNCFYTSATADFYAVPE